MYSISPWFWVFAAGLAFTVLWPADARMLPAYAVARLQLVWINFYMRSLSYWMWLQFPRPRPPFRFVPVQDRKPLK